MCGVLGICSVELSDLKVKPRVKLKSPLSLSKIASKVMTSKKKINIRKLFCAVLIHHINFHQFLKSDSWKHLFTVLQKLRELTDQLYHGSPTPSIMKKRTLCKVWANQIFCACFINLSISCQIVAASLCFTTALTALFICC